MKTFTCMNCGVSFESYLNLYNHGAYYCGVEPSEKPYELVSDTGGRRQAVGERWDLIPGIFTSLSEVAKVASYGAEKYEPENWKNIDPRSEQSPLNHGIRHAAKATELAYGSSDRRWQLAKAAWNMLAQIWFERPAAQDPRQEGERIAS